MLDGLLMSKAWAPPFPNGLSIPGEHDEPGGTTPPPRSSVTNMNRWPGVGSASWETDTPSSERTWLLELQLRTSLGLGAQSRPGWLNVPRNFHPVACSVRVASIPLQSVTWAPVRVPSITGQENGVPWMFPFASTMFETSRIRVALTA